MLNLAVHTTRRILRNKSLVVSVEIDVAVIHVSSSRITEGSLLNHVSNGYDQSSKAFLLACID